MHRINIKSSLIKQATKFYRNTLIQNEIAFLQNILHNARTAILLHFSLAFSCFNPSLQM